MTLETLLQQIGHTAEPERMAEMPPKMSLEERALLHAGITPDIPCYAGALQNVEHALQGGQPLSWWLDYQAYLEAHTDTYKGVDWQCIHNAIPVVRAIVYAMQQRTPFN